MRRAYLDACPGERRAVVTLDGRPERLWIERDEDPPAQRLGARVASRVLRVERGAGLAFLDMGEGPPAASPLGPGVLEGAVLAVEVTAEPREGKGAVVRVLGPAEGVVPRLLAPGTSLEAALAGLVPDRPITGERARDAADAAAEAAVAIVHALPGGGEIAVERTRALTAVDVDLAGAAGDPRAGRRVNATALREAARVQRLKGLGGLVVIDLVGEGGGGEALLAAAREAFAPEEPGVRWGPLSRLGLLQLALPWRRTPTIERLSGPRALASDAVRALQRAGRGDPGGCFEARLPPHAAALAAPHVAALGPRFSVRADPGAPAHAPDIQPA